jgi:hypothetical protein
LVEFASNSCRSQVNTWFLYGGGLLVNGDTSKVRRAILLLGCGAVYWPSSLSEKEEWDTDFQDKHGFKNKKWIKIRVYLRLSVSKFLWFDFSDSLLGCHFE